MINFFKPKKQEEKYIIIDCAFNCSKEKCPKWVVLNHVITLENGDKKAVPEGRCALAWIPNLLVELKQTLIQNDTRDNK